ncbi:response regulator [Zavarzinia sp. CC-PAN008]|uniref:response regulator n=1 Tax=Zavarzinia sp. CC-PAN008 TaxID=3243332 RepID=UPI003F746A5C
MMSKEIVKHLPYLRRYARAITGSQASGDQYIRACLETLLQEPERLDAAPSLKLGLYHLFHQIVHSVDQALGEPAAEEVIAPRPRLQTHIDALPAIERQVLLLVVLEGFPIADTAYIVGESEAQVVALLDQARADLKRESATRVLIIEDEPIIAMHIADIVRDSGHTVVGIAANRKEAVALADRSPPGLVLADIQLDDGSTGIEAVQDILQSMTVPVIFVTAFPERLLTGEKLEPTYLVTKPFEPDTLRVTMSQALLSSISPSA